MNPLLRILIVDDMPAVRSILKNMLLELGFQRIEEAESGDSAWELVRDAARNATDAYGLLIADWNMPGMSGVELLRAIRSFAPSRDLPFIIVTAQGGSDHLTEAVRAGVTDYLVKPFNGEQLGQKLGVIFKGPH
jgi:two-component system, chemotaxis family, chemotaxis protein CheY